jgi:hypothetical protein
MKQVWQLALSYLRNWKVPFKDKVWSMVDQFSEPLIKKLKLPLELKRD